jgi:hypothetical protein
MSRSEFMATEGLQGQLAEVLRMPIMQLAIDIVNNEGTSRALPKPIPGVDYGQQMAAVGAYATGWRAAMFALESLTNKPVLTRATNLSQNNMYIAEAKKRMMETENYTEEEVEKFSK